MLTIFWAHFSLDRASYISKKYSDFCYNEFMHKAHKNIFSDIALLELKRYIEDRKTTAVNIIREEDYAVSTEERSATDVVLNPTMGKIYFDLQDLPEIVISELTHIAKTYIPEARFHTGTYTEYSGLYGEPKLPMHKDRFDHFLLIDYQYDSNTNWDLLAAEDTVKLDNNDALVILPGSVLHGRPEKVFHEDNFLSMIFFDFWRN